MKNACPELRRMHSGVGKGKDWRKQTAYEEKEENNAKGCIRNKSNWENGAGVYDCNINR